MINCHPKNVTSFLGGQLPSKSTFVTFFMAIDSHAFITRERNRTDGNSLQLVTRRNGGRNITIHAKPNYL